MSNYKMYQTKTYGHKKPLGYSNVEEALDIIERLIIREKEIIKLYSYLITISPNIEEQNTITYIKNKSNEHIDIIMKIYSDFNRQDNIEKNIVFSKPRDYLEGVKRGLFGKLVMLEHYRLLYANLPNRFYRNTVFKILIEKLENANMLAKILGVNEKLVQKSKLLNLQETKEEIEQYSPDAWIVHIMPLVRRAMAEYREGARLEYIFQKYLLGAVLVGKGYTPSQAIEQVDIWEKEGKSRLLNISRNATSNITDIETSYEEAQKIAEELGIDFSQVDFTFDEYKRGFSMEAEQMVKYSPSNTLCVDPTCFAKIVVERLKEYPDYYTRLDEFHKQLEKEKNKIVQVKQLISLTSEQLSKYDGSLGNPAYVAVGDQIYDVSLEKTWAGASHFGLTAGKVLTEEFNNCHELMETLKNLPIVGILEE